MIHSTIHGNIGRDAECRTLDNGNIVVNFNVACRHGYGNKESTTWVRCAMFGERGRKLSAHLLKGQSVVVRGELYTRAWQTRDGEDKLSVEMTVDAVSFAGPRPGTTAQRDPAAMPDRDAQAGNLTQEGGDDVPF